jgi:hypothetical protein
MSGVTTPGSPRDGKMNILNAKSLILCAQKNFKSLIQIKVNSINACDFFF